MSSALPTSIKPLFPQDIHRLPCPRIGRLSSTIEKRICFYLHEWLLKPLSVWYCRIFGVRGEPNVIYPLPFGLLLKMKPRLREQEGLAMNLARAMGVPAPRFISYGEPPAKRDDWNDRRCPSILMTRVTGTELDTLVGDQVDHDVIKNDLRHLLACMRRFICPYDGAICGVDGGPVAGPLVPTSPLSMCTNEAAFHQAMRRIGNFAKSEQRVYVAKAEDFFALPNHAIVFTHGDLNPHNIMVGADGHISGIFDWEAAAWLPEYWEISITTIFPLREWGKYLDKEVTDGVYAREIEGHRALWNLTADSLSY